MNADRRPRRPTQAAAGQEGPRGEEGARGEEGRRPAKKAPPRRRHAAADEGDAGASERRRRRPPRRAAAPRPSPAATPARRPPSGRRAGVRRHRTTGRRRAVRPAARGRRRRPARRRRGLVPRPARRPRRAPDRRRLGGAHAAARRRRGRRPRRGRHPLRGPAAARRRHLRGARCRSSPATTASRSPTATARAAPTPTPSTTPTAGCRRVGELDQHLIREGRHERLWDVLGAHVRRYDTPRGTVEGVSFAVWAPNARGVKVTGDFDYWEARAYPMRSLGSSGVWEIFIPGVQVGSRYRYHVLGADGTWREKSDPLAFATEVPPLNASVVTESTYEWADDAWLAERAERRLARAADERLRGARRLVAAGPVLPRSWPTSSSTTSSPPASPTSSSCRSPSTRSAAPGATRSPRTTRRPSRFGTPDDLRYLVDRAHQAGIGVIVDWVPAHFPKDEWALARFDGTPLYEHADPRRGEQLDWGTYVFDFGRSEVRNFLVANALYWCQGVPHRRPPRRRGGLDALPGLLARRLGAQHPRRPGEPRGGGVPAGDERDRLPRGAGRGDHRRGVDRLAGRHPADPPRRPGLRLQVEHGLDARLAGLHASGRRCTAATTTAS